MPKCAYTIHGYGTLNGKLKGYAGSVVDRSEQASSRPITRNRTSQAAAASRGAGVGPEPANVISTKYQFPSRCVALVTNTTFSLKLHCLTSRSHDELAEISEDIYQRGSIGRAANSVSQWQVSAHVH